MALANRVPMAVLEVRRGVVESVMKSHRLFANVWFEAQCAAASVASAVHVGGRTLLKDSHRASAFASCSCCSIEGVFRSRQGMVVSRDRGQEA